MIGRIRLCAFLVAGLFAAAPAAAQADSPNPFGLLRAERYEHARPRRHQAWRTERRGERMEWKGERMERRGERWERRGRWLRRHGRLGQGRGFTRKGNRWEWRGERFERRGEHLDRRADRLRHRGREERHHRWRDGSI